MPKIFGCLPERLLQSFLEEVQGRYEVLNRTSPLELIPLINPALDNKSVDPVVVCVFGYGRERVWPIILDHALRQDFDLCVVLGVSDPMEADKILSFAGESTTSVMVLNATDVDYAADQIGAHFEQKKS